jgi:hypothetical protein
MYYHICPLLTICYRCLSVFFNAEFVNKGSAHSSKSYCNGVAARKNWLHGRILKLFASAFLRFLLGDKQISKQGGLSTTRRYHLLYLIDKEKRAGTRREKRRGPGESSVYQAGLQATSWAAEPM